MTLGVVANTDVLPLEIQTVSWRDARYIYHPTKRHFASVANQGDVLKTKAGYIVRRCQERRDGNLLIEIDERALGIPIVMTPDGEEYGALSLTGVQEMVKDITSKVVNAGARKLGITDERYQSPILRK